MADEWEGFIKRDHIFLEGEEAVVAAATAAAKAAIHATITNARWTIYPSLEGPHGYGSRGFVNTTYRLSNIYGTDGVQSMVLAIMGLTPSQTLDVGPDVDGRVWIVQRLS